MSITKGRGMLYGKCENKPELPAGWKYIEDPANWLLVQSPEGRQYFVEVHAGNSLPCGLPELVYFIPLKRATIWDYLRTRGRHKLGTIFADDANKIGIRAIFEEIERREILAPAMDEALARTIAWDVNGDEGEWMIHCPIARQMLRRLGYKESEIDTPNSEFAQSCRQTVEIIRLTGGDMRPIEDILKQIPPAGGRN